jgi:hypothetical protein
MELLMFLACCFICVSAGSEHGHEDSHKPKPGLPSSAHSAFIVVVKHLRNISAESNLTDHNGDLALDRAETHSFLDVLLERFNCEKGLACEVGLRVGLSSLYNCNNTAYTIM